MYKHTDSMSMPSFDTLSVSSLDTAATAGSDHVNEQWSEFYGDHLEAGNKRRVQFAASVHVREFAICMGDDVPTTRGPSISMEWKHQNEHQVSLAGNAMKKNEKQLVRSAKDRINLLLASGHTLRSITSATHLLNKERLSRNARAEQQRWERLQLIREKVHRTGKKILRNLRKRKDQKFAN